MYPNYKKINATNCWFERNSIVCCDLWLNDCFCLVRAIIISCLVDAKQDQDAEAMDSIAWSC